VASFQHVHISIGRASDSDLLFDSRHDCTVSSHHAVVRFQNHCFEFTDAHSTNGTYLNGQRTTHAILKSGDVIRLGTLGPEIEIIIPAARKSSSTANCRLRAPPARDDLTVPNCP